MSWVPSPAAVNDKQLLLLALPSRRLGALVDSGILLKCAFSTATGKMLVYFSTTVQLGHLTRVSLQLLISVVDKVQLL